GVLIDPPHAGGVGPEPGLGTGGEPALNRVQVLEHARAGPIEICPILEDHVHERRAEHRLPAHDFHLGDRKECGEERVRDLILHHLGRLARPVRVDDDLGVREVGDRVHGHGPEQQYASHQHEDRAEGDQLPPPDGPGDKALDHGRFPFPVSPFPMSIPPMFRPIPIWSMSPWIAAARFDSESSRNVAEATTSSPGFKPSTISTSESPRSPTRTSRATNRPSPRFTKTRSFVPVGSTASSGTLTPPLPRPAVASAAVAYMPGRKAPSPLSTATRAVSVRVFSSSCG